MAANGRIEPGESIATAISAKAWNRAQDAADIVLGVGSGVAGKPAEHYSGASNIVLVRNDSGAEVKASGILGISGVANAPQDASNETPELCRNPVLIGIAPTIADHSTRLVVTLEPIASGGIGRAASGGVVAFRLESSSASHNFATVKPSSTLVALSSGAGFIRILARTAVGESDWVWAVGSLSSSGSGVRLCKTSSAFNKGTTATLNVWESGAAGSETQSTDQTISGVVNKYANISANKFVTVAAHGNGQWYVIAAECL